MTSTQIRTLILPASISQSTQKTLSYLDERFSDYDSLGLIGAGLLDEEFEESSRLEAELASEVCACVASLPESCSDLRFRNF